jgi:hypothetical protein
MYRERKKERQMYRLISIGTLQGFQHILHGNNPEILKCETYYGGHILELIVNKITTTYASNDDR